MSALGSAIVCIATLLAAATLTPLVAWMLIRRLPRGAKVMVLALAAVCTATGAFKSLRSVSSSDVDVTLVRVEKGVTNGMSMVVAAASCGIPAPAWYRLAETNEWTDLMSGGGWTVTTNDLGGVTECAWTHPGTNAVPQDAKMWHFGSNPPPVEISAEGGVTLLSAAFDSRRVTISFVVDSAVDISRPGTRIAVQSSADGRTWTDRTEVTAVSYMPTTVVIGGFYLDQLTYWRVRLEVPQ